MHLFNVPVDFSGLAIIGDDAVPVPAHTGSCLTFAAAVAGTSSNLFLSPSSLASGSMGGFSWEVLRV
jgi:hypothetical protein